MIIGIGIDIIEIERIKRVCHAHPKFSKRILTEVEWDYWQGLPSRRQVEFLAGRFAAKEALAKALGTGVGRHFSWQDAAIVSSAQGAPEVIWYCPVPNLLTHLSIAHSQDYACAQVILEEKNN